MSCVDGSRVARVLFGDDAVVGCSLVSGLFGYWTGVIERAARELKNFPKG
jgi:hypothetical protein